MIGKIFHWMIRVILYLLLFVVALVIFQYMTCPVFEFPQPKPFSGHNIYNPYQNMGPGRWYKANFQVQSKAWGGVTDGRKNSNEMIIDAYKMLGYDVPGISDYQKINRFADDQDWYIPVYEHGYGIEKNHHVVIGAEKVLWRDYPIFQNLNHKQHILDLLKKKGGLVFIAHPNFSHRYLPGEMKHLSNYDGIEVLNGFRKSIGHWDTALSAGRYVTILADDDAHDVSNPDELGQFCTFIFSPDGKGEDILNALRNGRAFGAEITRPLGESMLKKAERHSHLPKVLNVSVNNDTIRITLDSVASQIRFVGQNGALKLNNNQVSYASYILEPEDTYIRAEIEYHDGTTYYLNPIARYETDIPGNPPLYALDKTPTLILRSLFIIGILIIWMIVRRRRLQRIRSKQKSK